MKLVYVNADPGIALGAPKGGAVHIAEMLQALTQIGAQVRLISARVDHVPESIESVPVEQVFASRVSAPVEPGRHGKELGYLENSQVLYDQLLRLYDEWRFDFIYERYSLWSDAGVRAGRYLNVPCLCEFNAPLVDEQLAYRELVNVQHARAIQQSVVDNAHHLFVVSDQLRTRLCQSGVDRTKITVLGNGVNLARFNVDRLPGRQPGQQGLFTIGFTGSLKNWHGIRELMQAFVLVHSVLPGARLLIVGDGPKRQWLEGFAEGAGIANAVEVTGWVDHEQLPALLARMDVATAPYPDDADHYFSPLKLFEYLAMGRPVVASRIGQTAQLLRHGVNAWLVDPGSGRALADGLLYLQRNPQLAAKLGAGALIEAQQHSWARNARTVVQTASRLFNGTLVR